MAITKTWGYSEDVKKTSAQKYLSKIAPATAFGLLNDSADSCCLINDLSSVDLGEKLTYSCRSIPTVASGLSNSYPGRVQDGVQYQIKLDEQLSLQSSDDPTYREDIPITAYLTIRHPRNGNITNGDIETIVLRVLSACYKGTGTEITPRFGDLMKSALKPTTDLS